MKCEKYFKITFISSIIIMNLPENGQTWPNGILESVWECVFLTFCVTCIHNCGSAPIIKHYLFQFSRINSKIRNSVTSSRLMTYFRLPIPSKKSTGNQNQYFCRSCWFIRYSQIRPWMMPRYETARKSMNRSRDSLSNNPVIILGGILTSETDLSSLNLDFLNIFKSFKISWTLTK